MTDSQSLDAAESSITTITLPARSEVANSDTWDLGSLYQSVELWNEDYERAENYLEKYAGFQGRLSESAETLAKLLIFIILLKL